MHHFLTFSVPTVLITICIVTQYKNNWPVPPLHRVGIQERLAHASVAVCIGSEYKKNWLVHALYSFSRSRLSFLTGFKMRQLRHVAKRTRQRLEDVILFPTVLMFPPRLQERMSMWLSIYQPL